MTTPITMSAYPAIFGATHFDQMRGYDISPEMTLSEVVSVGSVDRVAVIQSHSDPRYRMETNDLQTVFEHVNIVDGWCVSDATFQAQARQHCGVFQAGPEHYTFSNPGGGFLFIERFSWRQDDPDGAMLSCVFVPFFDGTNEPIKLAMDQNLIGVPTFNSQFYGGKATMNVGGALQTTGMTALDVDTGMDFRTFRADGDVYARTGSVVFRKPVITATFIGEDALRTDGANKRRPGYFFNSLSGSGNLDFYLHKGIHGGRRHPLGDAEHIRVRVGNFNAWHIGGVRGRDEQNVESTWVIRPVDNDWSVSVDTAVAA